MQLKEAAPLIDAGMINLFFEDGDWDTYSGTEIVGMVELYGDMYVRRITPFAGGVEIQVSNQPEARKQRDTA